MQNPFNLELPQELAEVCAVIDRRADEHIVEVPAHSNRGTVEVFFPKWQLDKLHEEDARLGHLAQGPAWCAFATNAIWHEAWGKFPLGAHVGSVHECVRRAKERSLYVDLRAVRDSQVLIAAYPGCAFVMLDEPYREHHPTNGHIGLVRGVSSDGWQIRTGEGNSGDRFRIGVRDLRAPKMDGLILPFGTIYSGGTWPREVISGDDLSHLGTR